MIDQLTALHDTNETLFIEAEDFLLHWKNKNVVHDEVYNRYLKLMTSYLEVARLKQQRTKEVFRKLETTERTGVFPRDIRCANDCKILLERMISAYQRGSGIIRRSTNIIYKDDNQLKVELKKLEAQLVLVQNKEQKIIMSIDLIRNKLKNR